MENTQKLIEEIKKNSFHSYSDIMTNKFGEKYRFQNWNLKYPSATNWLVRLFEKASLENTGKNYNRNFSYEDYSFYYDRPEMKGKLNGTIQMKMLEVIDSNELFNNGGLIAPNGNPSNLTPQQYELVRTKAFISWFGDWENDPENASKVVDENGEPLVVYYGTSGDFNVFDVNNFNKNEKSGDYIGEGFYFTNEKNKAKQYGFNTKSFFLKSKNPILINDYNYFKKIIEDMFGFENVGSVKIPYYYQLKKQNASKIRNKFIEFGYDGLIDNLYNQYAVFEPTQIKLADGTNTTFDGSNPDIRFDDGGNIEEVKNYLKNIRVDKDYMESVTDLDIVQYQSDFGRKGTLTWRAYPEWGKDGLSDKVSGSIYISSIDRGTGGENYDFVSSIEGKKDSRGEGAIALASLFLRYPLVHSVHYEDESGFEDELGYYKISFWQKIGGDESELMREDFFNYFTKKFGYNPDSNTQNLLERYKLLEELIAEEIKEKPKNLSYYKRLVALKEKRKKYIESINPDIRFVKGGSVVGKEINTLSSKDRLAKEKELIKYFTKYKAFRKKNPDGYVNSYGVIEEYNSIRDKIMDLKYDLRKPKKVSEIESMRERKSAIPSNIIVVAWNDLVSNKKIFDAISEAMAGVHYNKNTAIDDIVDGINRNTSIIELHDAFINTRKVLKNKYGKTITLYRSHGQQMRKSTQNWISTLEGAEQYVGNIEKKEISIENIIALNVGMDANYEEFIVYIPKSTNGYASFEGIVSRRKKFDFGGSISDLLSIEQIEKKLVRKLHWWDDDVVSINGIEYKKVFLRPEYKRL